MLRLPRLLGLLLVAALVLPVLRADDDNKKKDDPTKKKEVAKDADTPKKKEAAKDDDTPKKKAPADKEKKDKEKKDRLSWGLELIGRITVDGNSQGDFTLHVTQKILEPDYGAQQQYAQQQMELARHQLRMATARTLQERNQAALQYYQTAMQLAQTQQRLFRARDHNYDVQLRFADKMKVRSLQPPLDYDDKGNPKKYTAKELDTLRGKEGLPGFAAEMDAVRSGQIVQVYVARNQGAANQAPKAKAPAPKGAKKKAERPQDDDEEPASSRPEAVMIVILREPPPQ
jgi:hypothetical protein